MIYLMFKFQNLIETDNLKVEMEKTGIEMEKEEKSTNYTNLHEFFREIRVIIFNAKSSWTKNRLKIILRPQNDSFYSCFTLSKGYKCSGFADAYPTRNMIIHTVITRITTTNNPNKSLLLVFMIFQINTIFIF